jgi:hypothetical protein
MANGATTDMLYLFPSNAVQFEGDSGTTSFSFQVARLGNINNELTVDYAVNSPFLIAVVDGRLPAGPEDFGGTFPEGSITFAEGEAIKTITVEVTGDEDPEVEQPGIQNADLFYVTLSNPSSDISIAMGEATGIILNDDPLPSPDVLFGPQNIIMENAADTNSIAAADLDGDNDIDILTAGNSITWYENANGDGSAWNPNPIATEAANVESVFAADMDGDGDFDVLTVSPDNGGLGWYENQDGNGGFSEAKNISIDISGASSVSPADIDADGDADILVAGGSTVAWYENLAETPDGNLPDSGMNGDGQGQVDIPVDGPTFGPPSVMPIGGEGLMEEMVPFPWQTLLA